MLVVPLLRGVAKAFWYHAPLTLRFTQYAFTVTLSVAGNSVTILYMPGVRGVMVVSVLPDSTVVSSVAGGHAHATTTVALPSSAGFEWPVGCIVTIVGPTCQLVTEGGVMRVSAPPLA
jgi:hypothetical protein